MKKILVVLLVLLTCSNANSQTILSDSLLSVLRAELTRGKIYDKEKEERIDQLRMQLTTSRETDFDTRFELCSQLFEEYRHFRFDSAFVYIGKMVGLSERFNRNAELIRSKLMMGTILLNSGLYKEAFDITREIDPDTLSAGSRTEYLFLRARLYASIADYNSDAYFAVTYRQQSEQDFKNAAAVNPSNAFEQTIDLAFTPDLARRRGMTPDFFYRTILDQHLSEHGIAMVATRVSYAYSGADRVPFLALAAINDIRSSTKETLAIFLLGRELFELGRIDDAYLFMQEAVRNAKVYGARNRAVQIESILPLVASKLIDQQQHEKDKLLIGFLTFLIIAVVLFFLLVVYRRQLIRIKADGRMIQEKNKELEKVNAKLWESSRIKEKLIGLFFKTCSAYIETLDKLKQQVLHDIKLRNYKNITASLNEVHIDEEKGQLYSMLDSVFLTMFPNFISSFNALLKKEDQIWPKSGETLNATLRIFALIRLGINEHEAIAKILN
jgi:tetratricopeptide (TPR) repeat protein